MYMMRTFILAYIVLTLLLILVCSGCSTVTNTVATAYIHDPRCQPRQWCPYTDPPAPVRTEVLRNQQ